MGEQNVDYSTALDNIYFDYGNFSDYGSLGDYENVSNYYVISPGEDRSTQDAWFPGYAPDTADRLLWFFGVLGDFYTFLDNFGVRLSFVGIFFNIFHIIVLARREMLNNSINLILIVIAINDIMSFILEIYGKPYQLYDLFGLKYVEPEYGTDCIPWDTFWMQFYKYLQELLKKHFQRVSAWLAILMAGIRTLCVMNADNPDFPALASLKFGFYSVFVELLLCVFFSSFIVYPFLFWYPIRDPDPTTQFLWERDPKCEGVATVKKQIEYSVNQPKAVIDTIYVIDGISIKIIPCLCYPILTFLLARTLFKVRKARKRLNQKTGTDHTTHLVIGMTGTFMIAEIPQAVGYILSSLEAPGIVDIGTTLVYAFSYISFLNGTIHCFICFLLSSLYRGTVYDLLCIRKMKCRSRKVAAGIETTHIESGMKTTVTR